MIKIKLQSIRVFFIASTLFAISAMSPIVTAATFFKTGTVLRTLTDSISYGGCMVLLSSTIENGCPNNGWISLDCKGKFSQAENGKRAYASALVALSLGKRITVLINNAQKNDGYCVARRVDILR